MLHSLATSRWTLPLPRHPVTLATAFILRATGIALLIAVGLIHLGLASLYYQGTPYIGILFYASALGAVGTSILIAIGARGAWILGVLVAGGALIGLVLSTTVGLPGFADSLSAPGAIESLYVEGFFLGAYVVAAAVRRTPLGA